MSYDFVPESGNPRNSEGSFLPVSDSRLMFAYTSFSGEAARDYTPANICIVYSDEVVYMEVYVEQWMQMYWGSDEPEVIPTDAHVYFVKIDGKWYVGGIQY